jgi:hypothetical protein
MRCLLRFMLFCDIIYIHWQLAVRIYGINKYDDDPHIHEDSSPNWGAGIPETGSVISLTAQNHINSWYNI